MNKYNKQAAFALVLMLGIGSSFVCAQISSPPLSGQPKTGSTSSTSTSGTSPSGTSPGARGPGARGLGTRGRQPHMEAALLRLQEARLQLDNALPDKGGKREQAIKSIDKAITDVQEGIDYARDHPEEFPGDRGARGPRAGGTSTTSATGTAGG